jgi:hypothetical protein
LYPLSAESSQRAEDSPSVALCIVTTLFCLPATLYGIVWVVSRIVPASFARAFPHVPVLANFFAICWFIVVLAGRPLCAVALVLEFALIFRRKAPAWPKLVASAFLVFAVLGTLLVESQAAAVRH